MARIIALDYGSKRTGIAVTDPLGMIASPLDTVASHVLMDFLKDYFAKEEVEEVVVGLPSNLNGGATDATPLVYAMVNRFKKLFPERKVVFHDERFTSKMAMDAMIAGGMKKKDRRKKENVDKISAAIILQSHLSSRQF